MKINYKILFLLSVLTFILGINGIVFGATVPEVEGKCAILIEKSTGKVLFEKSAESKAYPASTTKILTAILMLEYIDLDEIIVMGNEVLAIPSDSSKAGHTVGESISGYNLLRGLMLPSGNESGCVVASVVAKRSTGNEYLTYAECEKIFAELMNEKAVELGAVNSHFVNPHGYHDENHYTTAKDMALICKAALSLPAFSEVVSETVYKGESVTENVTRDMVINSYEWRTTNKLITEDSEFYYEYAKGIKTGFTGPAGYCLASTAEKDGLELISIVFHSEDDLRYEDSIKLYNFGFDNFEFNQVQKDGIVVGNVALNNPKLGEATNMDVVAKGEYSDLFMKERYARLASEVVYNSELIYVPTQEELEELEKSGEPNENEGKTIIKLPVEEGAVLGHISYTIDGEEIYNADIVATISAEERTGETDYEYYKAEFLEFIFTKDAIPYWIGAVVVVLLILLIIVRLIQRAIRRKRRYRVNYRNRRY